MQILKEALATVGRQLDVVGRHGGEQPGGCEKQRRRGEELHCAGWRLVVSFWEKGKSLRLCVNLGPEGFRVDSGALRGRRREAIP